MIQPTTGERVEPAHPRRTCVAEFVAGAIEKTLHSVVDVGEIAIRLDTRVGPDDVNPWGLPVTKEPARRGVIAPEVFGAISLILGELDAGMTFVHIPFNRIPNEDYQGWSQELLGSGAVVGVGCDAGLIHPDASGLKHLVELVRTQLRVAVLCEDSGAPSGSEFTVTWDQLAPAVLRINDGYWVVGRRTTIAPYMLRASDYSD